MAALPGCALRLVLKAGRRAFSQSEAAAAPLSAQQLAEKIGAEKREQKKKQVQVPKDKVAQRVQELAQLSKQLQRVHPNVLAKALKNGILYQNKEIVVINKPYGLPVHGGPKVKMCITDVLPVLAKMLDGVYLHSMQGKKEIGQSEMTGGSALVCPMATSNTEGRI